ncbi:uncharacterized protein Z518_03238 [Rhinocladiella mackenziei CBS 650.93]|uniref:Fungal N-terminal domain-containing protein n=1 Tax=Rhinocladiella mackenziei CBS 650.93 TaxID=1442369 RepID=A0A0D2G261_9EURO|nr:uncharacterized protein Z518_03238 [Rhinocladiella mackenziei CBS 650.93]KIX08582.1 hypothetical protein Z518_03238 [Rhinocladiella mackenziei CBS 650.93]
MAEIVGVVAAAVEFGKIGVELKQLYGSAKHAPEALGHLLEELDSLRQVLQTLAEQEATIATYASPSVAQTCRQQCDKAVNNLKPICDDLAKSLKHSRIRGSIKSVFKEEVLAKARQDLERAKTSLILAQLALLNAITALNIQQHSSTQTLLVTTQVHMSSALEDIRRTPRALTAPSRRSIRAPNDDGKDEALTRTGHAGDRSPHWASQDTTRLMLFQSRLLGKGIDVFRQKAYGGWAYVFRTYNVRKFPKEIYGYIEEGNITALRQLFRSQQASIYDRDTEGWSLLLHAAARGAATATKFLVEQGVDDLEDYRDFVYILFISNVDPSDTSDKRNSQSDTICALLETMSHSRFIASLPHTLGDWCECVPHLVPTLVQRICPPLSTLDFDSRLKNAYIACWTCVSPDVFWLYLCQSQLTAFCLVRWHDERESIVQVLARGMSQWWTGDRECKDFSDWQSLLQSAIAMDGLQLSFEHGCPSPMLNYLEFVYEYEPTALWTYRGSWPDLTSERLTYRLQCWAREVQAAGQDLEEYGQWEYQQVVAEYAKYAEDSPADQDGHFSFAACYPAVASGRLVAFTYGKQPQDWRIWISTSLDEYAAEFWETVHLVPDAPDPDLPGAWPHSAEVNGDMTKFWQSGFKYSRKGVRRWRQHLISIGESEDDEFEKGWREMNKNRARIYERKRAMRARFFQNAGITPPP